VRRLGIARTAMVGEGVELFDIAERAAGLRLDPGSQAHLQRAVLELKRTARQRCRIRDRHDLRPAVGDGGQHRYQIRCDRIGRCSGLMRGFGRALFHVAGSSSPGMPPKQFPLIDGSVNFARWQRSNLSKAFSPVL
jgi:hypothetical protein